ncbi:hypothetical protein AADW59_00705 [Candidatus Hodgkinia cicadicola]
MLVLSGPYKRIVGSVARTITRRARTPRLIVCINSLSATKTNMIHAVVAVDKLKRLSLN